MRSFKVSNYRVTYLEAFYLLISIGLLSFFYVFDDNFDTWGGVLINLFSVLVILGLSLLFHEFVKKTVAHAFGISVSYVFFIPGFFASVIVSIFTQGRLLLFTYGIPRFEHLKGARLGGSRVGMRDDERAKIVLSGVIASVSLAILIKLLSSVLSPQAWLLGVNVNLWIALFSLVPLPKMNGSYILIWSRLAWVSSALACIVLGFLLPVTSIFVSLIFLVGVVVAAFFFMQSSKLL